MQEFNKYCQFLGHEGMQSEKNWYTACSTIRSDDILVSSNVALGPRMILHDDDGDDN